MQEQFEQPEMQRRKLYTPALVGSQKIIKGEILIGESSELMISNDDFVDASDNLTKRRRELEQLKRDLENCIVTLEEYENEHQAIINKYPLR